MTSLYELNVILKLFIFNIDFFILPRQGLIQCHFLLLGHKYIVTTLATKENPVAYLHKRRDSNL